MQSRYLFWILGSAMSCAAIAPVERAAAEVYRMTVQSHADLGGKCLDTPHGRQVPGMRLQMWDCNKAPSQVLVYDDQTGLLKMGPLCVTSWGRGDAQDAIGLEACTNSPKQQWKMVEVQDYYQITGVNGLCLNLRYADKDNNAGLQTYACAPDDVADLWALIAAQ